MIDQIFNLSNYTFSIYGIFPIVVGLMTLAISIIAILHENFSQASNALFLLSMTLVLWLLNCGMIYFSTNYATALFWTKMEHIGVAYIPFAASLFTLAIVKKLKKFKYFLLSLFVFCSLSLILVFTSNIFLSGLYKYFWGYFHKYSLFGLLFVGVFALSMITNLYLQWIEFKTSNLENYRRRIRLLLIGYCIAYVGSVDFIPAYGLEIYPFGYIPIFIFLMFLTRAIWRYNLVDISPAMASKHIIKNMNDILIITDMKGHIRLINPAGEHFFKFAERNLVDKHIFEIIKDDLFNSKSKETLMENLSKIKNKQIICKTRDKETHTLNFSSSLLKNALNNPIGIVLTAKDRSEYTRTIDHIKDAYQYTKTILGNIPVGIMILDTKKTIRVINKAALKMMGLESENDIIGKSCDFNIICSNKQNNCPADDNNNSKITAEAILIGPNKKKIVILKTSLKTVINGENVVLEAFINITKRKELEKQLQNYKDYLEDQVEERTKKLQEANSQLLSEVDIRKQVAETLNEKVKDLEKCREDTMTRENEMIEIKKMINAYCERLNRPAPYNLSFLKK